MAEDTAFEYTKEIRDLLKEKLSTQACMIRMCHQDNLKPEEIIVMFPGLAKVAIGLLADLLMFEAGAAKQVGFTPIMHELVDSRRLLLSRCQTC